MEPSERRDLLETLDDRYDKRSTMICTQLLIENWHEAIGDPTLADAILDRLVNNAYRLGLEGQSMRQARGICPYALALAKNHAGAFFDLRVKRER